MKSLIENAVGDLQELQINNQKMEWPVSVRAELAGSASVRGQVWEVPLIQPTPSNPSHGGSTLEVLERCSPLSSAGSVNDEVGFLLDEPLTTKAGAIMVSDGRATTSPVPPLAGSAVSTTELVHTIAASVEPEQTGTAVRTSELPTLMGAMLLPESP